MTWRLNRSSRRAILGVAVLLGLLGFLERAGITDLDPRATVVEVWAVDDGGFHLEVLLDTCNADVSVDVEEHDDRIVVRAKNHDRRLFVSGGDDCQDLVRVDLERPLGTRAVTSSSGDNVLVTPGSR
jgi:hypothetical protein